MNSMFTGGPVRRLKQFLPLVVLVFAACEDPFGPSIWDDTPQEILIYSASRAEYIGLASAVDIATPQAVIALPIEAPGLTGNWDFALIDHEGGLALVAAGAFEGLESRARIGVDTTMRTFEEVTEAMRDTAQYTVDPVPVELGNVYVVRSRRASCGVSSGYRYAKLRPTAINVAAGTLEFEIVRNPYCDNRSFVPPEE